MEFWNCTYREASLYVQSFLLEKKETYKTMVGLLDMFGDKLLIGDITRGFFNSKPEHISLVEQLFPEELNKQSPQDMARRLRSWKGNVKTKGENDGG